MRSFLYVSFPDYDNPRIYEESLIVLSDEEYELHVAIDYEDYGELYALVANLVELLLSRSVLQLTNLTISHHQ